MNKNALSEFLQDISNRISSPISGTFFVTWSLVNWPVTLVIIFGSNKNEDRVSLIKDYLSTSNYWELISIPLFLTVSYLFVMPLLREMYDGWTTKGQYRTARDKIQADEDLAEVKEYRNTVKAISGYLKQSLIDHKTRSEGLLTTFVMLQRQYETLPGIQGAINMVQENVKTISRDLQEVERFHSSFTGSLPNRYEHYAKRFGNLFQ